MHPLTINNLDTLARWTREAAASDATMIELDAILTKQTDDCDTWASLQSSFGIMTVRVNDAMAINDAGPFLRRLRKLGFRRVGKPTQNAEDGTVKWQYIQQGIDPDADRVRVDVELTLKKATMDNDGPSCQYVAVGVKEVPVMKLICGEELAAYRAAQQVEA